MPSPMLLHLPRLFIKSLRFVNVTRKFFGSFHFFFSYDCNVYGYGVS
ncbi:unnamed protein product, partial [Brassica rapa subsp. trilocularis]